MSQVSAQGTARMPAVLGAVDRVRRSTERLEEIAKSFEQRLALAARPAEATLKAPGPVGESTGVQMADGINGLGSRLEDIVQGLDSLLGRLEI